MPQSFVNQATARCNIEGSKYWFNCNPAGPHHWFKLEWIDKLTEKNAIRIHFEMTDNPSLSQKLSKDISECIAVYSTIVLFEGCGFFQRESFTITSIKIKW